MNSFKIAKELIFIADCVNSKIAKVLINAAEDIVSFDMTEREWKEYHKQHPNADKSNHHIIPVPGKEHHKSDHKEYMKREKKAKKEYFKKMKQEHPNYVPIVPKDKFLDILEKGEYSCISAGINGNDPKDVENAKNNPDFIKNRTASLRKDLDKLGVKYTEITGSYGGEEPSFMISHNLNSKTAQKEKDNTYLVSGNVYSNTDDIITKINELGTKYNQDSVAHGKDGKMEWHYTTGENAGKRIKGLGTELLNNADDFYSEARIGDGDYTKWACDMSPAFEDNPKFEDNPYFKKK